MKQQQKDWLSLKIFYACLAWLLTLLLPALMWASPTARQIASAPSTRSSPPSFRADPEISGSRGGQRWAFPGIIQTGIAQHHCPFARATEAERDKNEYIFRLRAWQPFLLRELGSADSDSPVGSATNCLGWITTPNSGLAVWPYGGVWFLPGPELSMWWGVIFRASVWGCCKN